MSKNFERPNNFPNKPTDPVELFTTDLNYASEVANDNKPLEVNQKKTFEVVPVSNDPFVLADKLNQLKDLYLDNPLLKEATEMLAEYNHLKINVAFELDEDLQRRLQKKLDGTRYLADVGKIIAELEQISTSQTMSEEGGVTEVADLDNKKKRTGWWDKEFREGRIRQTTGATESQEAKAIEPKSIAGYGFTPAQFGVSLEGSGDWQNITPTKEEPKPEPIALTPEQRVDIDPASTKDATTATNRSEQSGLISFFERNRLRTSFVYAAQKYLHDLKLLKESEQKQDKNFLNSVTNWLENSEKNYLTTKEALITSGIDVRAENSEIENNIDKLYKKLGWGKRENAPETKISQLYKTFAEKLNEIRDKLPASSRERANRVSKVLLPLTLAGFLSSFSHTVTSAEVTSINPTIESSGQIAEALETNTPITAPVIPLDSNIQVDTQGPVGGLEPAFGTAGEEPLPEVSNQPVSSVDFAPVQTDMPEVPHADEAQFTAPPAPFVPNNTIGYEATLTKNPPIPNVDTVNVNLPPTFVEQVANGQTEVSSRWGVEGAVDRSVETKPIIESTPKLNENVDVLKTKETSALGVPAQEVFETSEPNFIITPDAVEVYKRQYRGAEVAWDRDFETYVRSYLPKSGGAGIFSKWLGNESHGGDLYQHLLETNMTVGELQDWIDGPKSDLSEYLRKHMIPIADFRSLQEMMSEITNTGHVQVSPDMSVRNLMEAGFVERRTTLMQNQT